MLKYFKKNIENTFHVPCWLEIVAWLETLMFQMDTSGFPSSFCYLLMLLFQMDTFGFHRPSGTFFICIFRPRARLRRISKTFNHIEADNDKPLVRGAGLHPGSVKTRLGSSSVMDGLEAQIVFLLQPY